MGRGQGREATDLLFGRPVRGQGPRAESATPPRVISPESFHEIVNLSPDQDPYPGYNFGHLVYVPEPFVADHGAFAYDALYLADNGFTIVLGSDSPAPGLVETYPSLVEACRALTGYRRGQPGEEFLPPADDKIDIYADKVLRLMEDNVVWRR